MAPGLDISCCTFAAPIVGDGKLAALMESTGLASRFTHVVWRHDIVPRLLLSPGTLLHSECPLQLTLTSVYSKVDWHCSGLNSLKGLPRVVQRQGA